MTQRGGGAKTSRALLGVQEGVSTPLFTLTELAITRRSALRSAREMLGKRVFREERPTGARSTPRRRGGVAEPGRVTTGFKQPCSKGQDEGLNLLLKGSLLG